MTKIIEPNKQSNIFKRPSSETGIWSWITTVDHKRIGILYFVTAFIMFLVAGIEAGIMRMQLATQEETLYLLMFITKCLLCMEQRWCSLPLCL